MLETRVQASAFFQALKFRSVNTVALFHLHFRTYAYLLHIVKLLCSEYRASEVQNFMGNLPAMSNYLIASNVG